MRLAGSTEGSDIGDVLFSRLSAVTHVTWFGLHWAFDLTTAERDDETRLGTVAFGTNATTVSLIAYYVVRVLRAAATAHVSFTGWDDDSWRETLAKEQALEIVFRDIALSDLREASDIAR
jgi:hypothetical protein